MSAFLERKAREAAEAKAVQDAERKRLWAYIQRFEPALATLMTRFGKVKVLSHNFDLDKLNGKR